MQRLPRQQQLQPDQHGLRNLPSQGFSGDDESQSRFVELPANLRSMIAVADADPTGSGLLGHVHGDFVRLRADHQPEAIVAINAGGA